MLVSLLVTCSLIDVVWAEKAAGTLSLKLVFDYAGFPWPWTQLDQLEVDAIFNPEGEQVFLIYQNHAEVLVLNRRNKQIIPRVNYRRHFSSAADRELAQEFCILTS